MRRGEIANLEWSKSNLELGQIYITQTIPQMKKGSPNLKLTKNGKPRKNALSETLLIDWRLFLLSVKQSRSAFCH